MRKNAKTIASLTKKTLQYERQRMIEVPSVSLVVFAANLLSRFLSMYYINLIQFQIMGDKLIIFIYIHTHTHTHTYTNIYK